MDSGRVVIELPTVLLIILILLVAISSSTIGYFIGKSVNSEGYSGRIVDTLPIRFGRPREEQVAQVYRFTIYGRVLDPNGCPYSNLTVEIQSEIQYTTTDQNGWFKFENVLPGRHRISVVDDGVVLAYCNVIISSSSYITSVKKVLLDDGSYLIEIPVILQAIKLEFELDRSRSSMHLSDVSSDITAVYTGDPGDLPDEPGGPEEPCDEDSTEIPEEPEMPVVPVEPVVPAVPGGQGGSVAPGGIGAAPYIMVTGETDPSKAWTQSTPVDIFAERPGNTGVRTIDGRNVIVPGARGRYIFRIQNVEKVPVRYWLRLIEADRNNPRLQMKYRLKRGVSGDGYINGDSWKWAWDIGVGGDTIAPGESLYYTLEWKWDTGDDALDTAIGSQEEILPYILEIIITAESDK